jgi:hypothetical protein
VGGDSVNKSDPSGRDFGIAEVLAVAIVISVVVAIPTSQEFSNQVKVEVHFDRLGHIPIYGDYYHAFLLVYKQGSPPLVFRAGPSEENPDAKAAALKDSSRRVGPNEDIGFGNLTTGGCVDVPWTAATNCDFPHPGNPNEDAAKMTVPTGFGTADLLLAQLVGISHYIDALQLPYHPVTQNSNSFVHTLIKKAHLGDVPPPVGVPGWDHVLY